MTQPKLELKKLLGFNRVVGYGLDDDVLARALGASLNKAGAEGPPPPPDSPLRKAVNEVGTQ
jgi:hypothetical protein